MAQHNLAVSEYNAMTVKKTVGGHGRAGKPEVARVVARLLGRITAWHPMPPTRPRLPLPT